MLHQQQGQSEQQESAEQEENVKNELEKTIEYAHNIGRKVYAAVNIYAFDEWNTSHISLASKYNMQVYNDYVDFPIAMANIEALANGELRPGIYDILEEITTFAVDGIPYKETRIINCVLGGQYDCQAGNYWRHWTNGGWSDWFYV